MKLTRSESARVREAAARVEGWLNAATLEDLANGLEWYDRARREAERIAAETGLTTRTCAGVIAALSPRCQWATNVRFAEKVCHAAIAGYPCPAVALGDNRAKAWRIANGEDPGDVLSGPKVRAFFANIMGDTEAVTIDVWAQRAAMGIFDQPHAPKRKRYELLAESYRRAARKRGMHPRDVQAAVWTVYRRHNARALYDLV